MKRLLLLFIVIFAMCQNAIAYDFKVGNLYYNVISSTDLTVEVTSQYQQMSTTTWYNGGGYSFNKPWGFYDYYDVNNGWSLDYCTDPAGNLTIPSWISYQGIVFSVTRIGNHAFYGCNRLTSITIPASVSSIGDSAFWNCQITSIRMEASIDTIGKDAFYGCYQLTTIFLSQMSNPPAIAPNALNSIPLYASIYVPCNSIYMYLNDLNWSRFPHVYGVGAAGELIMLVNDTLRGRIDIVDTADCYSPATIEATANYGYHFISWNDGIITNPRTVTVNGDTSFTAIFGKNIYYINGMSANNVMGNVVGSDSALYLDTVTLVPVSNYGYQFSNWSDGIIDNPRKVVVGRDSIFTAHFDSSLFALQTLSNNEQMGYARIGSGDYLAAAVGNFKYLSTQTIYATPTESNQFMQWSDGLLSNPRIVTIYGDTSFMAVFAPKYVLSVQSANDSMGTVTGGGLFNNNVQAVITAQANYGYHFTSWNDGVTTATRTITVTSDTSFTANFARNQYSITATSSNQNWGSVIGGTNALYGDSVTLTATAIGQHHFSYWSDGTNQYTDNPLRVRVTKNDYYTAYFEVNQYQVSVFTDGGGNGYVGLESTNNTGNFDYMTQVTIRAVPYPGNRFAGWSDGIVYNPRAFTITKDTMFTALFAADIYSITVNSSNDVMGSVTGGGIYKADSIAEIAAVPNHGYKFDHWQDNVTINPRNVTVITNQTYTAYFVTYDTLRIHDTSYVDVFVHDTTVVVDSVWVYDTTIVTYTDTVINTVFDTIITTVFDTIVNTIYDTTVVYSTDTLWLTLHDTIYLPQYIHDTIYLHDTTYINVYVHDTTTVVDTVTLTEYVPVHDTTYIDVYVHDTTSVFDTVTLTEYVPVHDTTYIDVYVHDTTTVVDTVTLTEYVPVHDTTYIDVYVHDTTIVVDTVTLTEYVPVHDTTYIMQTDTMTFYDTTVVVSIDTLWLHDTIFVHDTIYIHDTIVVGVDEVEAINAKIYTSRGQIVVDGSDGNPVWLYDVNGRVLATKQDEFAPLHFDVPASGAYMVKIGNHPAQKVVVVR